MTNNQNNFDKAFEIDREIRRITGDSPFTAEGLRDTSHLSKIRALRVEQLRRKRDRLTAAR